MTSIASERDGRSDHTHEWCFRAHCHERAMVVGVTQMYCIGCERKHRAQFFRKGLDADEPYAYCKTTHNALTYQQQIQPHELFHPAWSKIKKSLIECDSTGHPICSLHLRADLQAVASQDAMVQDSKYKWNSLAHRIYFSLFAFALYWPWPMASLWNEVRHTKPTQMTPQLWSKTGKKIRAEFSDTRACNGILMHGQSAGLIVVRNPSSRDGAMEDFGRYCKDAPAVLKIAQEIAAVLTPPPKQIEIGTILRAMARSGATEHGSARVSSKALSGKHDYRNVRTARAIIFMLRLRPADSEDDWQYYRSMSTSLSEKVKTLGIWTFGDAKKMRDAIRAHLSKPAYSFGDLACLVCLMG